MGKVHDGKIVTTSGFKFNANAPLDDRAVVLSHADLNDIPAYEGMEVYVKEETKSYKYIAGNWVAVATEDYVTKAIENLNIQTGSANVLTPEMFGAVGDGSTDDTAALQAMIDAATDGKVFLFTSANGYRVGSTLNIQNKHHLTFAHANLIFGDSSTSRLEACMKINGGSSNISFENCSFRYGSQVIWLWACENIRVSGCTFDGCGYCVIQQMGYVSDHVFVTDNLAKNCVQDFVECNCEVDAPSKNWTVTGNIYVRDEKPVAPAKTECRFLGATAIRNVIISNNIIENVRGDSCISLEDPYGEIVIDGNTFTDCIGTGYIQIVHGDKNTIVSNNHFVNTMADNGTPFIYLYDSGSASPYTKEFSVIVEGNLFNGNGTQANPLVNIDYTSYPFIIKNNVFRNIGIMFDHVGGQNISFDGNDVMCATFFLVDASKAGYTQNSTFSNNRIVGDITITNDYNGKVCSGLSFTGNYLDGTVSITNANDILFAGNIFTNKSVFTFDVNGYYHPERMERYGNFQVGVGLLEPRVLDEDGIVQERGNSTTAVMSQKAATDLFALKSDLSTLSLGVHTDGLIHIFMNGVPVGDGVEIGAGGDVVGYVDIENNIVIRGSLPDGTYTIQYEMEDGSSIDIGNLVLDTNVYYTVTNNLTNCTSSNSETRIVSGNAYSATISANDGYTLSSIVVTMGGVDITSSAVSGGAISIASVTGHVVITAVAEMAAGATNFFVESEGAYGRVGSDGGNRTDAPNNFITNYVAVQNGDIIKVSGCDITGNFSEATNDHYFMACYKSSKTIVFASGADKTDGTYFTLDYDTGTEAQLTITNSNVAYLRFTCSNPKGVNNLVDVSAIVINIKRNGEWL